jgi:Fur family ferric uptake transcriptional regulator
MMTDTHNEAAEARLQAKDIKPTAMRLWVVKELMRCTAPVSLSDLEAAMDTADKSTLFRTLMLFKEQHLVHQIDDGSGMTKYELCAAADCSMADMHAHFYCTRCHRTFCVDEVPLLPLTLPDGFRCHEINYVLKGLCDTCALRY